MIVPNPVADPRSLRTVAALMKADLQSQRLRVALGWPNVRCERHTVYAHRLIPFIERELKRLPLQNWMFE
jgi:hypothetical protein